MLAYYQEPTITADPNHPNAYDSWWVGLGSCGLCGGAGALNQAGTFPSGLPGFAAAHQGWFETLDGTNCNVGYTVPWYTTAGDLVGVGAAYQGYGLYEYAWTDLTTGSSYTFPGAGSCGVDGSTAEYIAERPEHATLCPQDPYTRQRHYFCALGKYSGDTVNPYDRWYETSNSLGVSTQGQTFQPFTMTNNAGNTYLSYDVPDSDFNTYGGFYTVWSGWGP